MQAHILSAGIVEYDLSKNRNLYLMHYMNGNLLPPPRPLKDNDGGCVSAAECTITVLVGE